MVEQVNKTVEKSTMSKAVAAHAKAAIGALENLRWDGEIHGFKAGGSVDDLTLWFTTDWLKTDVTESRILVRHTGGRTK
jgi:predicted component of type VI protein secretion system